MKKKQPIEGPDRLLSGDPDGLLTPDEVAAVLRCSKKTVLRHVNGQSDPIIPPPLQGRILPAGSPLVQFEVQRGHKGKPDPEITLPVVVWVDRNRPFVCLFCGETAYYIPNQSATEAIAKGGGDFVYTRDPIVCPHQGRFVE